MKRHKRQIDGFHQAQPSTHTHTQKSQETRVYHASIFSQSSTYILSHRTTHTRAFILIHTDSLTYRHTQNYYKAHTCTHRRTFRVTHRKTRAHTHTPWTTKAYSHKTTEITPWLGKDHCMRLQHCTLQNIQKPHQAEILRGQKTLLATSVVVES